MKCSFVSRSYFVSSSQHWSDLDLIFLSLIWRQLLRLVNEFGEKKWAQIAKKLGGRAGKQCRERWHNHLRPDIRVFISSFIILLAIITSLILCFDHYYFFFCLWKMSMGFLGILEWVSKMLDLNLDFQIFCVWSFLSSLTGKTPDCHIWVVFYFIFFYNSILDFEESNDQENCLVIISS